MKIIRKGFSVVALAAFILGLFMPAAAMAAVTVTALGSYTDTSVKIDIYANTGGDSLRSFGVSLTDPNNGTLTSPVATVGAKWELKNTDTTVPGQVVLVGGNLDAGDPTAGITSTQVLLGSVTYTRDPLGDAPPFGLVVGLGRDEITYPQFANFVNTAGTELDTTVVFNMAAGVGIAQARVLWTSTDGRAGLWALDSTNTRIAVGDKLWGPYAGWQATSYQRLADGTGRLLWAKPAAGQAGLWVLDADSNRVPAGDKVWTLAGWTAQSYKEQGDGTARLLWSNTSGSARLWFIDATGAHVPAQDKTWGPYAGWTATSYQLLGDGTARLLWSHTSGQGGLWVLDTSGNRIPTGDKLWGPYSGWTATSYQLLDDGTARLLWSHISGQGGLWVLDTSGNRIPAGDKLWGPFSGWTATSYKTQ